MVAGPSKSQDSRAALDRRCGLYRGSRHYALAARSLSKFDLLRLIPLDSRVRHCNAVARRKSCAVSLSRKRGSRSEGASSRGQNGEWRKRRRPVRWPSSVTNHARRASYQSNGKPGTSAQLVPGWGRGGWRGLTCADWWLGKQNRVDHMDDAVGRRDIGVVDARGQQIGAAEPVAVEHVVPGRGDN